MNRKLRLLGAGALTCASLLSLPAAGHALGGVTITDDAGTPVPLANGLTLRNMTPLINPVFDSGDAYYALSYQAPNAKPVDVWATCSNVANAAGNGLLPYKGGFNGAGSYIVTVKTWTAAQYADNGCRGAARATQTLQFNIAPSISIGQFANKVLTRQPAKPRKISSPIQYNVPVNANPGADENKVVYTGPGLPPDGFSRYLSTDPATLGTVGITFSEPGQYSLTPVATDFSAQNFPVIGVPFPVTAVDPFDLSTGGFIDSRGPSYKWYGFVRTKAMRGAKVKFRVKSRGAKKYRTISTAKVKKDRSFTFKMRITKRTRYQFRVTYGGNKKVAGGFVGGKFRIRTRGGV